MEHICPLCNGLETLPSVTCPACGVLLENAGTLEAYVDPYAPYRKEPDAEKTGESGGCLHLLKCPLCGRRQKLMVETR